MSDPLYPPSITDVHTTEMIAAPDDPARVSTNPPLTAAEEVPPPPATPRVARPSPAAMAATQEFYIERRQDLLRQVANIEKFLGFAQQSDELAARVARLEAFVGLKG